MPTLNPPYDTVKFKTRDTAWLELRVGLTIAKVGGTWDTYPVFTAIQESTADKWYRGGYVHTITQAEADELTAAGYGDFITP